MALLNQQQTSLLTFTGFVNQFETYWLKEGLTQPKAFEEVNNDVKLLTGERRYPEDKFDSFITSYKQNHRAKGRQSNPNAK